MKVYLSFAYFGFAWVFIGYQPYSLSTCLGGFRRRGVRDAQPFIFLLCSCMGATVSVVVRVRCPARSTGGRSLTVHRKQLLQVWRRVVWKIILRNIFAKRWHQTGLLLQNRSIYLEDRAEIKRAWSTLGSFLKVQRYHRALKSRSD